MAILRQRFQVPIAVVSYELLADEKRQQRVIACLASDRAVT
jgi:hypothetical protein